MANLLCHQHFLKHLLAMNELRVASDRDTRPLHLLLIFWLALLLKNLILLMVDGFRNFLVPRTLWYPDHTASTMRVFADVTVTAAHVALMFLGLPRSGQCVHDQDK